MNLDWVLIGLQVLFITLYGAIGIIQSKPFEKNRWMTVIATYLTVSLLCIYSGDEFSGNIQLIVFLFLLLASMLQLIVFHSLLTRSLISGTLAFLGFGLLYFRMENWVVWLMAPLVFSIFFVTVKKWQDWFVQVQTYFLRASMLVTVLYLLEPVFMSIQKNLKPIPTIPVSSIINQQNFLLLAVLAVFVLGGFFWKEKSRS